MPALPTNPRLLILAPVFPHPASPAEGLFNEQHARALAAAGLDVTVLVMKPWLPAAVARRTRRWADLADLGRDETREGLPVLWARHLQVPGHRLLPLTVGSCARAAAAAVAGAGVDPRFDLLQVHGAWPIGLAAPDLAARLGAPYVVTFHIEDDSALYRRPAAIRRYRRALYGAAALVTVGRPLERRLGELFPAEVAGKLSTIGNGVDLAAVDLALTGQPAASPRPWGRLVSVGNLWPVKGIDFNLRALARLAADGVAWQSYTVVGDGPERHRLAALADRLGIADRVRFTGRLPHREALAEVVAADVFSLPCWREAFGVATLEAMACGKPAVGCQTQGAEDLIRHGVDGLLVEPRSVDSLAEGLALLLGDRDLARRIGRAARERAREMTWERNASLYLDLYAGVLAARRWRPPRAAEG